MNGNINGNGNGHTVTWRWIIGILVVVQMSLMAWISSKVEDLETKVYAYRAESNVTLLQERLNIWLPIVQDTRVKAIEMDKELSNMRGVDNSQDKRIDRLESRLQQ